MKYYEDEALEIVSLEEADCRALAAGFSAQGWKKPLEQYEAYLKEQEEGKRRVLTARYHGETAGYLTLVSQAAAGPFAGKGWPEIVDFNVLMKFQRKGIGTKLMDAAEELASRVSDRVVLGVGLHRGYGAAQRMYSRRGYVPDGSGVWYRDKSWEPYEACVNDDDLVLYLSKRLSKRELRRLTAGEITPSFFAGYDRFQQVKRCWRKEAGQWVVKDIAFTERWGDEEIKELCRCLQNTVATGGTVWGGFLDGELKGFSSVEGKLLGSQGQYADLSCIHVSAEVRQMGLGRRLFALACQSGRELGAKKLYISAHSSVESQAFYKRMGCVEAEEYDAHHAELEPCDCQLERRL